MWLGLPCLQAVPGYRLILSTGQGEGGKIPKISLFSIYQLFFGLRARRGRVNSWSRIIGLAFDSLSFRLAATLLLSRLLARLTLLLGRRLWLIFHTNCFFIDGQHDIVISMTGATTAHLLWWHLLRRLRGWRLRVMVIMDRCRGRRCCRRRIITLKHATIVTCAPHHRSSPRGRCWIATPVVGYTCVCLCSRCSTTIASQSPPPSTSLVTSTIWKYTKVTTKNKQTKNNTKFYTVEFNVQTQRKGKKS